MTSLLTKNKILLLIEILFLVLFILYLKYYVQWEELLINIKNSDKIYFLLSIFFYFLKNITESWKWKYISNTFNFNINFYTLLKYTCIAPFFSIISVFPKGEELYFFFMFKIKTHKSSTAVSMLIVNKSIGLISILLLLPFTLVYFYFFNFRIDIKQKKILQVIMLFVLIFMLPMAFILYFYRKKKIRIFITKTIDQLKKNFNFFNRNPAYFILLLSLNYLNYIFYALTIYFICLSLEISISLIFLFLSVPIIYLITFLTFTYKGLGTKEGAWSLMAFLFYVPLSKLHALTSLHFILSLFYIFIGFLLYFNNRKSNGASISSFK